MKPFSWLKWALIEKFARWRKNRAAKKDKPPWDWQGKEDKDRFMKRRLP